MRACLQLLPLFAVSLTLGACGLGFSEDLAYRHPTTSAGPSSANGSTGANTTVCSATATAASPSTGAWIDRTQGTCATQQLWTAVASDATGTNLVATSSLVIPPGNHLDGFWTSSNAGLTWSSSDSGPVGITSLASNASGTVLVAAEGIGAFHGSIWTSTSARGAWSPVPSTSQSDGWGSVASDSSGTHLAGGALEGDLWTSSDSGQTWTDRTPSGPAHDQSWISVASDATGAHLIAASGGGVFVAGPGSTGDLWTSSDAGVTWTDVTPTGAAHDVWWAQVASDATGTNLVAAGAGIWTSHDAGATWALQTPSSSGPWMSLASDATGTHLLAASGQFGSTGDLWTSSDSGVTWSNETAGTSAAGQAWASVASDATGNHLVAVAWGGDIWTR